MNCAIYVDGRLAPTKKAVKEAVAADPSGMSVDIEATAMFGEQYFGPLGDMPKVWTANFVGPNPWNNRKFYGSVKWSESKDKWVVS